MLSDFKTMDAIKLITIELEKAEAKHPNWPSDIVHQSAIMAEESGETTQAALDVFYDGKSIEAVRLEAAQTGAMALRILKNLSQ